MHELMENLLVSISSAIVLFWKDINIITLTTSITDGLVICWWLCFILSFLDIKLPPTLSNFFRQDNKLVLHYGCVVIPSILCFISSDSISLDGAGSIVTSLLILILVLCYKIYHFNKILCSAVMCAYLILCVGLFHDHHVYYNSFFIVRLCVFSFSFFIIVVGCPASFSVGEAIVVCNLIASLFSRYFMQIENNVTDLLSLALSSSCLTLIYALVTILYFMFEQYQNIRHIIFYSVGLLIMVLNLKSLSNMSKVLFYFLKENHPNRFILILCWSIVMGACVFYTSNRSLQCNASTAERKVFHIFILMVYIPGLLHDIPLLFISSALIGCLFVIISILVAFEIRPLGPSFKSVLLQFTGRQDTGKLILTPVYLLLGLSLPVWLACIQHPVLLNSVGSLPYLKCFSGILSVGIGDAFASAIGSKYGKLKIPGISKTVEGTAASIVSQLITVFLLQYVGAITELNSWIYVLFVVTIVSFVETFTEEIDNLILPLLMYLLLI